MSEKGKKESKATDVRKQILFKQVGAKIAYYRTLRDMSQEELAKRAHITQSTLSRIERGKYNNNISISLLIDIANSLQIDMALLVTFNDAEKQMWWHSLTEIETDKFKIVIQKNFCSVSGKDTTFFIIYAIIQQSFF